MLNRFIMVLSLVCLIVLAVMMSFTTPTGVGPVGVLIFFGCFYIVMFGVMTGIMQVFRKMTSKTGKMIKKDYAYAAAMALGPIMLILANSIGTNWWLSISGVVAFVALFCFVISKRL